MTEARHLSDMAIQDLLDEALSASQAAEARRHLGACRSCARRVEARRRLFAALETWEDSPPPHDLAPGVVRALGHRTTPRSLRVATAVQAGLAVLIIVLAWPLVANLVGNVQLPTSLSLDPAWTEALAGESAAVVATAEAMLKQLSDSADAWLSLAAAWMTLWPAIVAGALLLAVLGNSILLAGDGAGMRRVRARRL